MSESGLPGENQSEGSRRFTEFFGISEEQLRCEGIDPGDYARSNVGKALKDKTKRAVVLSPSMDARRTYVSWGYRSFLGIFVGFGILALSKVYSLSPYHAILIGLAFVDLAAVAAMFAVLMRYYAKYRRACANEGIKPDIRRRG